MRTPEVEVIQVGSRSKSKGPKAGRTHVFKDSQGGQCAWSGVITEDTGQRSTGNPILRPKGGSPLEFWRKTRPLTLN
jgi:hypothetical protein